MPVDQQPRSALMHGRPRVVAGVGARRLACRAFLFDLDGVLVDTMALIVRGLEEWAQRQHLDSRRVLDCAHGRTQVDLVRTVAPHLDAGMEATRLLERELADVARTQACRGALNLVNALGSTPWAIVTSGYPKLAYARLRAAGIPTPATVITASDVSTGKPDPEGYSLAARRLGVSAEDCLVFEDAPAGLAAGLRAGCQVVSVTCADRDLVPGCAATVMDLSEVSVLVN